MQNPFPTHYAGLWLAQLASRQKRPSPHLPRAAAHALLNRIVLALLLRKEEGIFVILGKNRLFFHAFVLLGSAERLCNRLLPGADGRFAFPCGFLRFGGFFSRLYGGLFLFRRLLAAAWDFSRITGFPRPGTRFSLDFSAVRSSLRGARSSRLPRGGRFCARRFCCRLLSGSLLSFGRFLRLCGRSFFRLGCTHILREVDPLHIRHGKILQLATVPLLQADAYRFLDDS